MIKQITEQLDLPLQCVYQMNLVAMKAARVAKKAVPCIPAMFQLCIEFDKKEKSKKWTKSIKEKAVKIAIGVIGVIGMIGIANWF